MIGRRALLKLLGATPIAGPAMARNALGPLVAQATPLAAVAGTLPGVQAPVASSSSQNAIGKFLWDQIAQAQDQARVETHWRGLIARGAIDADISALKSTSQSFKERKQLERIIEAESMIQKANQILWPRQ